MQARRRLLVLPVLGLFAGGISGCSTHGLALRQDDRVSITAPKDGAEVRLPMTVRWTAHDIDLGPGASSFGVVVDDAPPRPGDTADDRVVRTTATSAVLDHLGATNRPGGQGGHEITVILLDAHGRRQGEGAWQVRIDLKATT